MSVVDYGSVPAVKVKPHVRPSTVFAALVSAAVFLILAQHVVDAGYLRRDIAALQAGDVWRTGGWLSQIVLRMVAFIGDTMTQQAVLSLIAAIAAGLLFGVLYERLRAHGWYAIGAALTLLAVGAHAGTLYTLTAQSRAIPLYVAFAALIPAIRDIEEVGDVQAAIALGLLLPLLLLASPIAAALIVPIAIGAALAEPDGRRDPRAFVAILLVTLLPTIIVVVGILGFLAQAGLDLAAALLPYAYTYSKIGFGDWLTSVKVLAAFAPVLAVPLAYCLWPASRLPEKKRVVSALLIVALGLYLATMRVVVNTTMTPIVPAVALIAAFVSWLTVVRLPMTLRIFALGMLVLSAATSWALTDLWDDADWRAALFSLNDGPAQVVALRPGLQ